MTTWKMGDNLRVVKGDGDLTEGSIVTLQGVAVEDDVAYLDVGVAPDRWDICRFEKVVEPEEDATDAYVEPEPLKEGDWTLAWVQVEQPEADYDGNISVSIPRVNRFYLLARIQPDAIVRPDAGQVPPWVKLIEEPMGLGAVVDAEHAGEDVRFVRVGGDDTRHPWYAWLDERSYYADWTALKDPKVRSQGYIAGGAS